MSISHKSFNFINISSFKAVKPNWKRENLSRN